MNVDNVTTKATNIITSVATVMTALSIAAAKIAEQLTDLPPLLTEVVASIGAVWVIVRNVSPAAPGTKGLS